MTIDEHRAAGTCSVCGGRMDTLRGGVNRITEDEYRHGRCDPDIESPIIPDSPIAVINVVRTEIPTIGFRLLHPAARQPTRATPGSTGWDLYAAEPATIHVCGGVTVGTGLAVETPPGWAFTVRPRSGLSSQGIWAATGTIDQDYRGEIHVTLWNLTGDNPFTRSLTHHVSPGDRIAQLVLERVHDCRWEERAELGRTERGSGGFGSTGD